MLLEKAAMLVAAFFLFAPLLQRSAEAHGAGGALPVVQYERNYGRGFAASMSKYARTGARAMKVLTADESAALRA